MLRTSWTVSTRGCGRLSTPQTDYTGWGIDHPGEIKLFMKRYIWLIDNRISRRKQDHSEICWQGRNVRYSAILHCFVPSHLFWHSAEYDPIHPPDAITTNLKPEKQSVFTIDTITASDLFVQLGQC